MASNNLYPPIMDTYMPAFVVNSDGKEIDPAGVKIYFSLSQFNSIDEIKSVWLSITNQFTNEPVLNYATGLKYYDFNPNQKENDMHFISVSASDLSAPETSNSADDDEKPATGNDDEKPATGKWYPGQHYKVQLRFCKTSATAEGGEEVINKNDWISKNQALFSEWSKVSLLKPIEKPELLLTGLEANATTIFKAANNLISGELRTTDGEQLESYIIQIYSNNANKLEYDSGLIYSDSFAPNQILHEVKCAYQEGEEYTLRLTYNTESLYTKAVNFNFILLSRSSEVLNATITATPISELGCINVKIGPSEMRKLDNNNSVMQYDNSNVVKTSNEKIDTVFGSLVIKRTSNKSDFLTWEDIQILNLTDDKPLNVTWQDFSAEHGVWYKYCVQRIDSNGNRGLAVITEEPVMLFIEDSFLVGGGRSLKLKFNPQIGSYTHTMAESLTQTIGSKYPFIRRNAAVDYKQIGLSGMISHFMDDGHMFVEPDELYYGYENLYKEFNEQRRIHGYNDITLEREFRKEVQAFLLDGEVKLFKSPTEGNILVRLMNTSFTPEQVLGRMIYSFNTTMYEVANLTLENIDKYNIQLIGERQVPVLRTRTESASTTIEFNEQLEVLQILQKEVEDQDTSDKLNRVESIDKLNIQFTSEPYLIYIGAEEIRVANSKNTFIDGDIPYLGYLLYLNGDPVVIGPGGKFNIDREDGIKIYELSAPQGTATIEYDCTVSEAENIDDDPLYIRYAFKAGQVIETPSPLVDIVQDIIIPKMKYKDNKAYNKVTGIYSVRLEADPYSVFYIKDTSSDKHKRYVIGKTGELNLTELDFPIESIYAVGTALRKMPTKRNEETDKLELIHSMDRDWEYKTNDTIYPSYTDISLPGDDEENIIYRVNSLPASSNIDMVQSYVPPSIKVYDIIYYKNEWCYFTSNDEVIRPITCMIDYICEIEEGEYA